MMGKIFGWSVASMNDYRMNKALITAKYVGADIELKTIEHGVGNKTETFLKKFPLGKVPAFEGADGIYLTESNTIAYHIAASKENSLLLGQDLFEKSLIIQFSSFCDSELNPVQVPIYYGNPSSAEYSAAVQGFKRVLAYLDGSLATKTFLVGNQITLADILVVCSLCPMYEKLIDPEMAASHPYVTRYFKTCINQPFFKSVMGDFVFCAKAPVAGASVPSGTSSSAVFGKIYKGGKVDRVAQSLIAAAYNDLNIDVVSGDSKSSAFLADFPMGKVPAFVGSDGFCIAESAAIARYVASCADDPVLLGANTKETALIESYVRTSNEFYNVQAPLLYYSFGYRPAPASAADITSAKENIARHLAYLNTQLAKRTFLVGERVSLADIIVVCSLVNIFRHVLDSKAAGVYGNVMRWFNTCINQPHFKSVITEPVVFSEIIKETPKEAAPAKAQAPTSAKAAKKEKAPSAAKPKKGKEEIGEDLEAIAALEEKPKAKNPLDLLPKSSFVLDEWKRFYSNNDTRPTAVDWFWKNYDPTGYSLWKVDYKYNDELTQVFMSSNLIGGVFQRLESARKYAFGSLLVLGADGKNKITGYFVLRGLELPIEVSDSADFESFKWTKVNDKDVKVREHVNAIFAWDDKVEGLPCADGKTFK